MIEFRDASVTYPGGVHALKGLNLEIQAGQMVVIVGLSGAGKSTLIRAINGLVPLTSGDIIVDGVSVRRASTREHRATAYAGWPPGPGTPLEAAFDGDGRVCVPLAPEPSVPDGRPRYLMVDLLASTPGAETAWPARVHLYRIGGDLFRVVGLERPESDDPPCN